MAFLLRTVTRSPAFYNLIHRLVVADTGWVHNLDIFLTPCNKISAAQSARTVRVRVCIPQNVWCLQCVQYVQCTLAVCSPMTRRRPPVTGGGAAASGALQIAWRGMTLAVRLVTGINFNIAASF